MNEEFEKWNSSFEDSRFYDVSNVTRLMTIREQRQAATLAERKRCAEDN
jgi:hypothetical protein